MSFDSLILQQMTQALTDHREPRGNKIVDVQLYKLFLKLNIEREHIQIRCQSPKSFCSCFVDHCWRFNFCQYIKFLDTAYQICSVINPQNQKGGKLHMVDPVSVKALVLFFFQPFLSFLWLLCRFLLKTWHGLLISR